MSVTHFLKEVGRPVAYYPKLARMLDSINAAVFLCQLLYLSDKGSDPEGWIYKSQTEIEMETGLTRRKQESVRRKLKELNLLEEQRRGSHGTLHFRINFSVLDAQWSQWLKTPMAETANDHCTKPPNANGGNRQSIYTETTTKTTTEKSKSHSAAAPPKRSKAEKVSTADPRSKHPAIQIVRTAIGHYPKLILYDKIITCLGEIPDGPRVIRCATECASRGWNVENLNTWLFDWYVNGIPERNGNDRQSSGGKQHGPKTAAIAEYDYSVFRQGGGEGASARDGDSKVSSLARVEPAQPVRHDGDGRRVAGNTRR